MRYAESVNLRLPRTVRSIGRIQAIVGVLTHHGFGHLVDRLQLDRYVPLPKRWQRAVSTPEDVLEGAPGRRLVRVCEELGPTFIKLGQMISTRPDIAPTDIVNELATLQDRVPPFPTDQARGLISETLGASVDECFTSFEQEPFASGSIAQVYRATVRGKNGQPSERVVVKVKRPDIEETVRLDMTILRWIAELADSWIPEIAAYEPVGIVDEFERTMLKEMDFINEAATITRFSEAFGEDPHFRVPTVHWELTGPNVLTLEELHGVNAQTLLKESDSEIDRSLLANRIADAFMRQFFEWGLFHADPHPGNLLISPPAEVGLIDFGLTGQIDDELLGYLTLALVGAFNREPEIIVEVLADMNALSDNTDRRQLKRDFMELINKYYGLPLHRFDLQKLFHEITGLIRRNQVTLPREFVLFGKSLVGVGGICLQLDPQLDLLELIKPKLKGLLARRLSPAQLLKSATISGWHLLNILRSAPGQIRDISRRLARGQWQVNIRHQNLDTLAHEIDRASNRLGVSVIIGAIILGSSWVLTSHANEAILNVPLLWIGVAGYLVAGVMGLWLVIAILRSGKLS